MPEADARAIGARYREVLERIAGAAVRGGREPGAVRLVVVTKGQPLERIRQVVEAGARLLGENYAEEAVPKIEALEDQPVRWAMIGHVQSRKAALVASHFDVLHTLDSVKLARRLDASRPDGAPLPALVQVNVSGETEKFGLPGWAPEHFESIAGFIEQTLAYPKIQVRGLMTVPPFLPPDEVRPYFRRLAALRDRLRARFPEVRLDDLSIGMSGDFEAAIEEGATVVRVGSAILGPRG